MTFQHTVSRSLKASYTNSWLTSTISGVPTLYLVQDEGNTHIPITPMRFSAYYEGLESAEIAIRQDYKDVAGNASATSQEHVEKNAGISWFCEGDDTDEDKDAAAFPTKTCSTHLQTLLLFHDCVNPNTL